MATAFAATEIATADSHPERKTELTQSVLLSHRLFNTNSRGFPFTDASTGPPAAVWFLNSPLEKVTNGPNSFTKTVSDIS